MALTQLTDGLIQPGTIQQSDLSSSVAANISTALAVANSAASYANQAFSAANTAVSDPIDAYARNTANSAGVYANAAFAVANSGITDSWARDTANSASNYANGAFAVANTADQKALSAGDYANGSYFAANTADDRALNSGEYANSAFGVANSASSNTLSISSYANSAFNVANSTSSYANSAYSTANNKLNSTGGTISGDLSITGNLTVLGNASTIAVTDIKISDPLIQLAANNETSDSIDIGFIGHYSPDAGSTKKHTGLFRDATDGLYYLFNNYEDPSFDTNSPNNVINVANSTFRIANLTANIITDTISVRGYDPINHTNASFNIANSGSSYANSAFGVANTADQKASSAGDYANSSFVTSNSAGNYANAAYVQANTANTNAATADQRAVISGNYANSAFVSANTADSKSVNAGSYANGAFNAANTRLSTSGGTMTGNLVISSANLNVSGTSTFDGISIFQQSTEKIQTKTGATGTVTHDYSLGALFYHSSISANFTANITNVPTTNDRSIVVVLILSQGATAYIPNALQIDGSSQTIKWINGSAPSGNANQIDIVSFSLLRVSNSWTVLGQLITYN